MANLIFCGECGGLKCDESIGNYSWEGGFCHCDEDNQPNIDMGDYEYDLVAKIRFMKPKTMDYREHKAKLMKDPEFRKAYEDSQPEYQARRREIQERLWEKVAVVAERIDVDSEEIEQDIREAVRAVRAEYAEYAKQEIRRCPCCGAALGIL